MPRYTIVIVDDEEELRDNLQDLLEFKGYSVISFESGEEMLQAIDSLRADMALLDFLLPGMDGLELYAQLKQKKPNLPVALVTASSHKDTLAQAREAGVNRVILKPYSHTDILQAVAEMLGEK